MNFEKYYEECSQEDLLDVLAHLDKDAYPDRQEYIEKLFEARGGLRKLEEESFLKRDLERELIIANFRIGVAIILFLASTWVIISGIRININITQISVSLNIGTISIVALLALSIVSVLTIGHKRAQK